MSRSSSVLTTWLSGICTSLRRPGRIDAIASRQIKDLLHSFVKRGKTIFLTSHILEIVERLSDHVGVIHRGKLVAQGSLESLRSGKEAGKTLEEIFLDLVGAAGTEGPALDWLAG